MDLFQACENSDMLEVEKCLENGSDINETNDENQTVLFIAIAKNNYDLVKFLVEKGININHIQEDITGETTVLQYALLYYKVYKDDKMIRLLIDNGADLNYCDSIGNNEFVNELLDGMDEKYKDLLSCVLDKGIDLRKKGFSGNTALHRASSHWKINKNKSIIVKMVEKGADINVANDDGRTPFYNIINCVDLNDTDVEFIEGLIDKGADVNTVNKDGQSLLFVCKSVKVSDLLILKGLDIHKRDVLKQTPLHLFAQDSYGKDKILYLLGKGIDKSIKNSHNDTALTVAMKKRSEINERDIDGHEADAIRRFDELIGILQD